MPDQDRQAAEHDGDLLAVGPQPVAERPRERAEGDEHEREAEHEQEAAEHHPAALALLEVDAGQAGGVGEVAGQQRHHARREERHQPGDQRHRQRERPATRSARALEPAAEVDTTRRSCRASGRRVVDQVVERGAGDLADHAGRDPALLVDDDGARDGVRGAACRGRPAASGRRGRRSSRRGSCSAARTPAAPACSGLRELMPRNDHALAPQVAGGRRPASAPRRGTAGTTSPRRSARRPCRGSRASETCLPASVVPADRAGLLAVGDLQAGDDPLART